MMTVTAGENTVDLSRYADFTPLTVHPHLPLETVMELFKKMGPRVILVEHRGKLTGLVTVKDCLKYQFKVEAEENSRDEGAMNERQEKLWGWIRVVGKWIAGNLEGLTKGKIRMGNGPVRLSSSDGSGRTSNEAPQTSGRASEDDRSLDADVELQDRESPR